MPNVWSPKYEALVLEIVENFDSEKERDKFNLWEIFVYSSRYRISINLYFKISIF